MKFESKGLGFRYRTTKDKKTFIYYNNNIIKTLSAEETEGFLEKIRDRDNFYKQLFMAKITGSLTD